MSASSSKENARPETARTDSKPTLDRLRAWLFAPVDAGLLVFFRVAFGLLMAWEASRYLTSGSYGMDWIKRLYIVPEMHLKYYGFEWVNPWPGEGMYYHFWGLGILGILIAVGFLYRISMTLFFLAFTYIFLLDQATYLNHFYLISLISFLMIFLPLNRAGSVDAALGWVDRQTTAPFWTLFLMRFQVGIAYTYGGIAKLNSDWLHGEPMRAWLRERWHQDPGIWAYFYSWGGAAFDLLIVPALLWKPTRIPAFLAALYFHYSNDQMFQIGVFPWFMVAGTLVFMPASWVSLDKDDAPKTPPAPLPAMSWQKVTVYCLGFWIAFQTMVPFRHLLYPGNVSWTEEGHRFAWHMKLRSKTAAHFSLIATTESGVQFSWYLSTRPDIDPVSGLPFRDPVTGQNFVEDYLAFRAIDADGKRLDIEDPAAETIIDKQLRGIMTKPDMLLQYAHFLGERVRNAGFKPLGIYADAAASLNGRLPQPLIDPNANLLEVERNLKTADWILPLNQPLEPRWEPGEDLPTVG